MVRPVIAFAVVALGAAAVLAQNPEVDSLEYREYDSDEVLAREIIDQSADLVTREELFADLSAREVEQVMEYLRSVAEPTPVTSEVTPTPPPAVPAEVKAAAKDPSGTVTLTTSLHPSPTACTAKDLKKAKQHQKVVAARKTLKELAAKKKTGELTSKEKAARKKAMKVIKRARARNVKKAKKMISKCRKTLRKVGMAAKGAKCDEGKKDVCKAALDKVHLTEVECVAAKIYLDADKELKAAKKAAKKSKGSKEATEKVKAVKKKLVNAKAAAKAKVAATPTVGADGVPTVYVVKEGPTCTPTGDTPTPTPTSGAKAKRELFEEMEDIFAREYDFEELD